MMEKTAALPIVYISPYYEPHMRTGANRRFNELIQRFERDYADSFTLVVTKGQRPSFFKGTCIEIDYDFNHSSKLKTTKQISKLLDTLPPSIVILESVPIPFTALKRHVHFQVAYDFRYFTSESRGFLYRLIFSNFLKYQWSHSEFMVTCSDFSINELHKYTGYNPERVVKSFFGIDERVLDIANTPAPEKDIDIIYVGHYEKRKNHEPLIRALARVDKNIRARFIGRDWGLMDDLIALKDELGLVNTTITSENISDEELWELYRRSRVFAYPSIYEGFGIPLIEALALGVPVVCTDMDVFHEVGADFPAFFDPYNPDDIAEKIKEKLENPAVPDPTVIKAHLEKFFWENIYKKFVEDLYIFAERSTKQLN